MTTRRPVLTTAPGSNQGAFGPAEWVLFLGLGLIWGASFLFMAEGLESFEPATVTMLRVWFGAATIAVVPAARKPVPRDDWVGVGLLGVMWLAVPFTLLPIAQQWIDSAVTGMLNGSMPIWAAVVTFLLVRTPPGRWQLIGLVVGFSGVVAIGIPSVGESDTGALGVVLVVVTTLFYAVSANIAAPLQQRHGALPVTARALWIAAVLVAPWGLWELRNADPELLPVLAMLAVGILGTGLGFPAMGELVGRVGATRASMITYVIPVVALFLGVIVRDESVSALAVVGCALVICGAFLASRRER